MRSFGEYVRLHEDATPLTPEKAMQLLGVGPGMTQETLKKRYNELAKQYHPDTTQKDTGADFGTLAQAYATAVEGLGQTPDFGEYEPYHIRDTIMDFFEKSYRNAMRDGIRDAIKGIFKPPFSRSQMSANNKFAYMKAWRLASGQPIPDEGNNRLFYQGFSRYDKYAQIHPQANSINAVAANHPDYDNPEDMPHLSIGQQHPSGSPKPQYKFKLPN
jgi:hypothetical protein